MKRVCTTIAIAALCLATVRADVSVTQTITLEGQMAQAMGGGQPTMTTKIKGNKSRFDMSAGPVNMSSIVDLDTRQVIMLNAAEKTAQIVTMAAAGAATPNVPSSAVDVQYKPTGNKRTVAGVTCEDHSFTMSVDMSQVGAGQMPPETAKMMEGVKMVADGVTCIAREGKGVAEFIAFQKNAAKAGIAAMGGPGGAGGMDKLMAAATSAPGLPYVTEMTMTFEGTGPMVDMMKQMGGMKMTQTTTAVSTDAISDDLFKAPADYKITKK